jgi:hypothetical protein
MKRGGYGGCCPWPYLGTGRGERRRQRPSSWAPGSRGTGGLAGSASCLALLGSLGVAVAVAATSLSRWRSYTRCRWLAGRVDLTRAAHGARAAAARQLACADHGVILFDVRGICFLGSRPLQREKERRDETRERGAKGKTGLVTAGAGVMSGAPAALPRRHQLRGCAFYDGSKPPRLTLEAPARRLLRSRTGVTLPPFTLFASHT